MTVSAGHGEKKSRRLDVLIAALLVHPTIHEAAKVAGISERTASRWMQSSEFDEAYSHARRASMKITVGRMQAAAGIALQALMLVLRRGENESARVAAARCVLDISFRAAELEDVIDRVAALEKHLKEK